ncbi:MO2R5 protein, partial [Calyptomena viridis]|nr:MO2R5 protein [Calyptomena viridis]
VCSATGKPAPNITWVDERGMDESPEIHRIQNTNGTVTVTSRLTFPANHLHALCCLLDHPQGRKMKVLRLEEKERKGVQKSTVIMLVAMSVLLLIILIYCVMKLNNRRRKRQKKHSTPRTPAKETGLPRDLGEKASVSLHTPRNQHIVYQHE